MDPFLRHDIPAAARALSLVRLHHGIAASEAVDEDTSWERSEHPNRMWKSVARRNHMHARRRSVRLDEIPETAFPVILELNGGRNFVIVKSRLEDDVLEVQFPDSREAAVSVDRLREVYDGQCVFLNPKSRGGSDKGSGRFRGGWRRILARSSGTGLTSAIVANGLLLFVAFLLVGAHRSAFPEFSQRSLVLPGLGILAAAAVILGISRLRHAILGETPGNLLADGIALPVFALAMAYLAGWAMLPFLVFGLVACLGVFASSRMGSLRSFLAPAKNWLVAGAFLSGAITSWWAVATGALHPAMMSGSLIVGTYSVSLLVACDGLWQQVRLGSFT